MHKKVYEEIFGRDWSYKKVALKADQAVKVVRKYIGGLERNKIPIEKAILFGSYAKGHAKTESDIDVALVSEVFSRDRFEDRQKIIPLRRKIDNRIEPRTLNLRILKTAGFLLKKSKKRE